MVKRPANRATVERELTETKGDLDSAKKSLLESDFKWTIIKAYYSMFHACKSLLFSAGYVEKSHECLIAAIEELFTDRGILPLLQSSPTSGERRLHERQPTMV
ncbi:HEPN domain-containing protein [Methanoculleus chikugoensis]|uniref:HEPN domain-containing protein n=1 Tax=Methanoculleus chikugoensis TaxID=118126 RepID=A0ABN5XGQ0_9EURY|nr:HEPN domain-containing protein [Methanoculleus chikugoensis]BBL67998.1 hypothetical protein MchiMG62_11790 [Methanoculleus chikugoensis]